ncbi:MAG: SDR family oxidoreductase [Planctomycetota bacterium]
MTDPTFDRFRLHGHHALVTGGTQGIGAAIAEGIAQAGADVTLIGLHDDDAAQATLQRCRGHGVRCQLIVVDLAMPISLILEALFVQHAEQLRSVDLLVNNAGICIDVPFLEMDLDRYQRTQQVNVTAGYFLTQAFARRWVADKIPGRVLFTGSINGQLSEMDHSAYDTSKGAVASMVRTLCVALAPLGIRVNAIAPGLIRTPLTSPTIDQPEFHRWMQVHTPDGRVPGPEVCAGAAVFLLSDAAEFVHGQTLLVDGGISAMQVPELPS